MKCWNIRPVNLHPLFLKIGHPAFWRMGHPAFCKKQAEKKQGISLFKKRRDQAASSLFELQWPWFFALCFFQNAGCPIFKQQGARFLRIVGADWLGDFVNVLGPNWFKNGRKNFPTNIFGNPLEQNTIFLGAGRTISYQHDLLMPYYLMLDSTTIG